MLEIQLLPFSRFVFLPLELQSLSVWLCTTYCPHDPCCCHNYSNEASVRKIFILLFSPFLASLGWPWAFNSQSDLTTSPRCPGLPPFSSILLHQVKLNQLAWPAVYFNWSESIFTGLCEFDFHILFSSKFGMERDKGWHIVLMPGLGPRHRLPRLPLSHRTGEVFYDQGLGWVPPFLFTDKLLLRMDSDNCIWCQCALETLDNWLFSPGTRQALMHWRRFGDDPWLNDVSHKQESETLPWL